MKPSRESVGHLFCALRVTLMAVWLSNCALHAAVTGITVWYALTHPWPRPTSWPDIRSPLGPDEKGLLPC